MHTLAQGFIYFPPRAGPRRICDIYDFFAPHINVLTYLLTYAVVLALREPTKTLLDCSFSSNGAIHGGSRDQLSTKFEDLTPPPRSLLSYLTAAAAAECDVQ